MSVMIFIEGGGDSKEQHVRCREGFSKLLEKSGCFRGRMPRLVACGGRNAAFDAFKTLHGHQAPHDYVALWIDSEDPVTDIEKTWDHLKIRDGWDRPDGAGNDQVLFMTTCMETWIVADRAALTSHYGATLQSNRLPPVVDLEQRSRHTIQDKLESATRHCSNAYTKGNRSFVILAKLSPATLRQHLPSFARIMRILMEKL